MGAAGSEPATSRALSLRAASGRHGLSVTAFEMDEQRCARGTTAGRSSPPDCGKGTNRRDAPGAVGDRAKDAFLWPDPSRNERKLAEIADLRPGRQHLEIPANKPNSGVASAWIAPRRSPVRVRLAPLREPLQRRGFFRFGPDRGLGIFATSALKRAQTCNNSGWGEIFGDDVVAAAMIDRLVHHAEILALKGDSYRLKDRDLARPTAHAGD
jgi:IstB-like ATP binding protein